MKLLILVLTFNIWQLMLATISPGKSTKIKQVKGISGPQNESVFDLDLITREPSANDILVHHAAYFKETSSKHCNCTVLGYVTPWNNHGYDVAKTFAGKFDIIAPVWLQVVPTATEGYEIAGTHDIDIGWLQEVQVSGKSKPERIVKIFPRIILDHFSDRDIIRLISQDELRNKLNMLLIKTCKEHGFDGVVLELWSQLSGRVDDQYLYAFVLQMAKQLKLQQIGLIIVIPPKRKGMPELFTAKHLDKLYKHIYAFSLMTYDFSNVQRPGANAPLYWIRQSVEELVPAGCHDMTNKRKKILLGLNMYGNDYTPDGGGPIIYNRYLELLKLFKKKLTFDERDVENFFEVKSSSGRHIVFYPTLHSINSRITLAEELGVGLSIWELGQGLDYFYDLI